MFLIIFFAGTKNKTRPNYRDQMHI